MSNDFAALSVLSCQHLKGVGSSISERLAKLGIHTVHDLLFHLPMRYQDRTRILPIKTLLPGDLPVIEGEIVVLSAPKVGRTRLLCRLSDETGSINLRFFYINASQRQRLKPGVRIRCFGEVRRASQGLEMIHPDYRLVEPGVITPVDESLTPIYPSASGLSQALWRKLTQQALDLLHQGALLQELLPQTILKKLNYPDLVAAISYVHRPPNDAPVSQLLEREHCAQKRLVFEELLAHHLSLLQLKERFQQNSAPILHRSDALHQAFLQSLSFTLTGAQLRVIDEIAADLQQSRPMLRLVQGDVGSGKTVVAASAALQAIASGCQVALLAPTELLAEQHYQTFMRWLSVLNIRVVFLSGQLKTAEKREALQCIADGSAQLVIGTHALFQKTVHFARLGLIIVDEQHRFGVEQRMQLREKGVFGAWCPHQLMMTATPIPRTLAMSVYADLDCSIIDELPKGRTPVGTRVIPSTRREEILQRIREMCALGRQVYWVCTLIEESDVLQCQAAEITAETLKKAFPELSIGLIHGRMKSSEKDVIMRAFKEQATQLLVATTVIEVGVDVSNASLMVIENAERLGLSQLHQLRGRVGRGRLESHCVLLYQPPLSGAARERLAVMRETTDGFKIAERDLAIRGPGEVLGTRQTGELSLRIADLVQDSVLLPLIQKTASDLQAHHPECIPQLIQRWLKGREQFASV